jgi:hypothetical protein
MKILFKTQIPERISNRSEEIKGEKFLDAAKKECKILYPGLII